MSTFTTISIDYQRNIVNSNKMIKLNDDKIVILVLMLKNPLGVCTFRYGYSEAFVLSGCPQQRGSEISFQ